MTYDESRLIAVSTIKTNSLKEQTTISPCSNSRIQGDPRYELRREKGTHRGKLGHDLFAQIPIDTLKKKGGVNIQSPKSKIRTTVTNLDILDDGGWEDNISFQFDPEKA